MKKYVSAILLTCASGLMAGCASAPPAPTSDLFHDALFQPATEVNDAERLFALSPSMRAYLDNPEFRRQLRSAGPSRGLVDALYKENELKLDYDATETRPAGQTFLARKGNCLSLVVMTAAFAKALDLEVAFQGVLADEQWSRSPGLYIANTHVNLSLAKERTASGSRDPFPVRTVIDFMPSADAARQRTYPISEQTIVAMYLNNRAGEALAAHRADDSYWWARAAVQQDPSYITAYNTLGVAYQKRHHLAQAEHVYKRALQRAPEDTIVMHNLVQVLTARGKADESVALARRLAAIEPFPPYHFFEKGLSALVAGDPTTAKSMFAREVKRAPYNHEFHYWLAVAHLNLGETRAARLELTAAIDHSTVPEARQRYSAKLDYLRAMATSALPLRQ